MLLLAAIATPWLFKRLGLAGAEAIVALAASFRVRQIDMIQGLADLLANQAYSRFSGLLINLSELMINTQRQNNRLTAMSSALTLLLSQITLLTALVLAAISFQESGCGKKIPYVEGEPTYNAWGYGVYGDNVHGFDNWVQGIETMSRYLSKRFYAQGVTDTSDIMKTYTPPSMGSWYKGVDYFSNLIQNYSSSK